MFAFGDSFDCYATSSAEGLSFWDTALSGWTFVAGRFAESRAISCAGSQATFVKSSGQNDMVHHIVCAFYQTASFGTSVLGAYFQLSDGATAQCSVVFNRNGSILLTSGGPAGTVLATYASALTAQNTWYAFEIEVVVHNTTGSFKVRRNGNPVEDHSTTGLNTRGGTANNYANRLTFGQQTTVSLQYVDDLYWRSDASSVPWMGDIRCYTRMPASDAAVQFSRSAGASNFSCVDESQQNAATDYVFSSTIGHADLYGIAPIASTPLTTFAVTTRAYAIKSDAGTRTAAVQLKSGGTTVASPTLVLTTSNWQWAWRHDTVDPQTGTAWTAAAVNLVQCGPVVIA